MFLSTTVALRRSLIIASALSTSLSLAAPTLAHAADQPGLAIEEVVVTARKREENLQETPIAISAIKGAELQARGAADLDMTP